jgi:hypothetical protein
VSSAIAARGAPPCRRSSCFQSSDRMVAMAGALAGNGSSTAAADKASLITSLQTRLQKIVLSWDYLRLLSEFKVFSLPFLLSRFGSVRFGSVGAPLLVCWLVRSGFADRMDTLENFRKCEFFIERIQCTQKRPIQRSIKLSFESSLLR